MRIDANSAAQPGQEGVDNPRTAIWAKENAITQIPAKDPRSNGGPGKRHQGGQQLLWTGPVAGSSGGYVVDPAGDSSSMLSSTPPCSARRRLPPIAPPRREKEKPPKEVPHVDVAVGEPPEEVETPSPMPSISSDLDITNLKSEIQRRLEQIQFLERCKGEIIQQIAVVGVLLAGALLIIESIL